MAAVMEAEPIALEKVCALVLGLLKDSIERGKNLLEHRSIGNERIGLRGNEQVATSEMVDLMEAVVVKVRVHQPSGDRYRFLCVETGAGRITLLL